MNNLDWREFLKELRKLSPDTQLFTTIEAEFIKAEHLINCMSYYYELQTKIPRINVDSFFGSKNNSSLLYYDPKDMTINISSKLIEKYFKDKNSAELEKTHYEFLWGIAHEYFHHGRNHIAIWNKYGIVENDVSSEHNQILLCLEDDADTLATAVLYRHFLNTVHKGADSYNIKLKVLAALYKTIRLKIQETKNRILTTHPAWTTRLCSQIIKLSELDNVSNDPQCPKVRITKFTMFQQGLLTDELLKMEKDYCDDLDLKHYILKPVNLSEIDENLRKAVPNKPNYPITQRFLDLYRLNETTKEIEEFFKKNCNLPGLSDPKRQWQPEHVEQI